MEMKELVYLVTLAEEESISRAAERLYMAAVISEPVFTISLKQSWELNFL